MLKDKFGEFKFFGEEEKTLYASKSNSLQSYIFAETLEELKKLQAYYDDKETIYELKFFKGFDEKLDVISKKNIEFDTIEYVYASDKNRNWFIGMGKYGISCVNLNWDETKDSEYYDFRCAFASSGVQLMTNHMFSDGDVRNNFWEIITEPENGDE